jgi:hypothetical protein
MIEEIPMEGRLTEIPCPDVDCNRGWIPVCNAYSENPLSPEPQICEVCAGKGFLVVMDYGLDDFPTA